MNETPIDRPTYRVRREAVLQRVPDEVPRSAAELGKFFGLSKTVAWRLFFQSPNDHIAGEISIVAIGAKFPDTTFDELFIRVDRDPAQVAS